MMNRDRITRGRSYTESQTRLGLPLQSAFVFGSLSVLLAIVGFLKFLLGGIIVVGGLITFGLGLLGLIIFWVMIILAVFLTIMAWFRPDYRLPFISNLTDRMI